MPQFTQAVAIPTGRPDEQTSETEPNHTKSRRNRSAARCVGDKRKGWLGFQGQNTWTESMLSIHLKPRMCWALCGTHHVYDLFCLHNDPGK